MSDRAMDRRRPGRSVTRHLAAGCLLLALAALAVPSVLRAQCTPDPETLCLQNQRFAVQVSWKDFSGRRGVGNAKMLSDEAGYFWFFREANVELMVKVLDGRLFNGDFWVLAGALSTVEYTLTVTDTETGARREYFNPLRQLSSFADTHAFSGSEPAGEVICTVIASGVAAGSVQALEVPVEEKHGEAAGADLCVPGDEALCVLDGRFRVEVSWRDRNDNTGTGVARELSEDAGYFWFFREANIELVVKMVDGRPSNGSFWLFWGALSNVEYRITVTDMLSGQVVEYLNPLRQLASGANTKVFTPSAHAPEAPVITEPAVDGQQVSAFDVHMETAEIVDPDPGDGHHCSDFEIWALDGAGNLNERVWHAACVTGPQKTHTHLGDGVYEGSLAERQSLLPLTDYVLRVRHYDTTGVASDWGERRFQTRAQTAIVSIELADVVDPPAPRWQDAAGAPVVLGVSAGSLRLEAPSGNELLLEIAALDGEVNQVTNPPALASHIEPRLRLTAGSAGLQVGESELVFTDSGGQEHTLYLPALDLQPGEVLVLWISSNGSTYFGQPAQQQPRFTSLARSSPLPWQLAQPGYVLEVVAEGFQLPVNIAFVPEPEDGPQAPLFYVTELYGTIKTVLRDGTVLDYATGLLNFNPTGAFPGSGELGVTGTAVDPASGDLFVALLYAIDPESANPTFYPRVIRLHSEDGGRTAASQSTVLDLFGARMSPSHQISNVSLGPDGKLYVHVGDGVQREKAQDLQSYLGKILRLNLDGSAPEDNPFYDANDGISPEDYIYALGFRNPFGGAWRTADGFHYEVENGPSRDRFAKVVAGTNYTWGTPGVDENQLMSFAAIYNWEPAHAPVNVAFIQPETFGGSGFPASRQDRAFVSESGATWAPGPSSRGKRIVEFILDLDGGLVDGPIPVVEYNGSGRASVVALAAGPDGLYFSDFYRDIPTVEGPGGAIEPGSRVLRIRYAPAGE